MSQTTSPTSVPGQVLNGGPPTASLVPNAGMDFGFGTGAASSTAPSTATSSGPPLISQDQGTMSQYYLGQIGSDPVQVGSIPGLNQATTVGEALQDIYSMTPAELEALQQQLFAGGFYRDGSGAPMSDMSSIKFGYADPQTWLALGRALTQAATSGSSLINTLTQASAAGTGIKNIQGALGPVQGGGNAYQVNLTNPQDLYQTAMQIFESALGRAPTQAELDKLTQTFHTQESNYQHGLINQAESMSQQQYQAKLNARTALATPQAGNGPVPNGPINTPSDFAVSLLQYMSDPTHNLVTASNVAMVTAWISSMGGLGNSNNPLGVKTNQPFQNWGQSIQAVANMLSLPQYQSIYAAIISGDASSKTSDKTFQSEISQWSGGKVSNLKVTPKAASAAQSTVQNLEASQTPQTAQSSTYPDSGVQAARTGAYAEQQAIHNTLAMGASNPAVGNYLRAQQQQAQQAQQQTFAEAQSNPAVARTLELGATNPQVGAYLTAQYNAAHQQSSQQTLPPGQTNPNQQGLSSPGDFYLPANTLTSTQAPSASSAAFTAATTGSNAVPYLGNQYLNAYGAILSMIKAGGPTG